MPRDKTVSHARIISAARAEFLEKGFQRASVRAIGARVGMTSAALYRHFRDKEELFAALVGPAIREMDDWMERHMSRAREALSSPMDREKMWQDTEIDMILEVVFPRREEFKLILCCSQGTRYEHFIHDLVEDHQRKLTGFLSLMRSQGMPVRDIRPEELHMLLSAYTTALFEPIAHDWSTEDAVHYIRTVEAFFMPGWHDLMGC